MPEGLKIIVSADVSQATTALKSVTKELNTLDTAAPKATTSVTGLSNVLKQTSSASQSVGNSFKILSEKVTQAGESATKAGSGFSLLSGFIAGAAIQIGAQLLKALIDTIFHTERLITATKSLSNAQFEASASTRDEVLQLNLLFGAAKDISLTYEQRQAAINKLNKSYPELHGNLRLETVNSYAVANAIDEITQSLIARARADLLVKQIAELQNAQFQIGRDRQGTPGFFSEELRKASQGIENLVNNLLPELQKSFNDTLSLKNIGDSNFGKLFGKLGSVKIPKAVKIKAKADVEIDVLDLTFLNVNLDDQTFTLVKDRFKKSLEKLFEESIKIPAKFLARPGPVETDDGFELIKKQLAQEKELSNIFGIGGDSVLSDLQKQSVFAANSINSVLTPAFQNLFSAIVSGGDPLKAFFQGLGQAVQQLISKLIAAAVEALILSAIFPGGLGGAQGFGSIFGKLLGFAGGGVVTRPTLALIGEGSGTSRSNPEIVAPLDQLRSMLDGMGGGGRQVVVLQTRIRGNDMLLSQARTSRSQRRTTGR